MIQILQGDCREVLRRLPDASVHMVVTSPPYYGLRDYGTATWEGGDRGCAHNVGGQAQDSKAPGAIQTGVRPGVDASRCRKCGAVRIDRQMGLEQTPDEYVSAMVDLFREVRRVLRADAVCFINIGDSYAGSWGSQGRQGNSGQMAGRSVADVRQRSKLQAARLEASVYPSKVTRTGAIPDGSDLKPKDLIGIPWMLAFALRADGWYLRKDIIWHKPNPMPESAKDRPTSSHEHVFMLTKSPKYFFDAEAVREISRGDNLHDLTGPGYHAPGQTKQRGNRDQENALTFRGGSYVNGEPGPRKVTGNKRIKVPGGWDTGLGAHGTIHRDGRTEATYQEADVEAGRNIRDVWTIATRPFPGAHFATFAPELAERCIKAGTSEKGCCASCGAPWRRIVVKGEPDLAHRRASGSDLLGEYSGQSTKDHDAHGVQNASDVKRRILEGMREKTYRWEPTCACNAAVVPAVVLDPFAGAFTSMLVADRLQRDGIGIELSAEYCEMARRRLTKDAPLLTEIAKPVRPRLFS